MTRADRAALAALLALAASTACRGPEAGSAAGAAARPVATDRVDLPRSYLFRPTVITVPPGTRVTWTNHDAFTHAVQLADSGSTPLVLKPGDSVSLVLAVPGTHRYTCPFHPQMMRGSVLVTASAARFN